MGIAGIAILIGVLAVLGLPALPPGQLLAAAGLPLAVLACLWRPSRILVFVFIGASWCWWSAHHNLERRLAPVLEGQSLVVTGWVASIPQSHPEYTSFEFAVDKLEGRSPGKGVPKLIRLSWSRNQRTLGAGEHWRLRVRLKRPRGFMNPGGFDYEGWLFRHGLGATGYVIRNQAERLDNARRYPLLRLRSKLFYSIQRSLPQDAFAGVAAALAVGERSAIKPEQRRLFQSTGTAHLLSISGLHIGLVAGLIFLLVRRIWRRSSWLCARLPTPLAAMLAGLLAALAYATMAGFSVPTQRALIMLAAMVSAISLRRHSRPLDMLGLAMVAVLALNPLSAGEVGFWLSFTAVAAIYYVFAGRLPVTRHRVMQLLRTQWAVGVGLLPLLVFFFHRATLIAPLANLVMVPVYSLTVVPLVLAGALVIGIWPWAGGLMLKAATSIMAWTWPLLRWLSHLPFAHQVAPEPSWLVLALACIGALWLMLPRPIPSRWLGAVLMLPLFLPTPSGIPKNGFNLTLLDVGQGLSAVVRTTRHTLIYDTGPGFAGNSDTGEMVVIPWLQSRGIQAPDLTIISHADNDHAGGLRSLRAVYPRMPVLSGEASQISGAQPCLRGQVWQWDGVLFRILSPLTDQAITGNDASCVLQIIGDSGRALLVGDLMRRGEQQLVGLDGGALASAVLVAPHHGSLTSSSPGFIQAVSPRLALFPVGYRNRWGFPKPRIVAAYRYAGARVLDTARAGAVEIRLWPGHPPQVASRWRLDEAHFWTTH